MGNPLPFSTVAIIGSDEGSISNQDGQFKLIADAKDSVEVRHTGFVAERYAVTDFGNAIKEIKLIRAISQLAEFNIVEADERALKYIGLAKKQLQKSGYIRSKAFLELFTEKDSLPTELLEVYYNADLREASVESLEYKSGRIAIAPVDNSLFMSLSTSRVIQSHDPLNSSGFPESAFSLKKSELKDIYEFKLIEFESGEKVIFFEADSANSTSYFSGSFTLDENLILKEVEFEIDDPTRTPFIPLFKTDSLQPLSLEITWFYSQQETGLAPYLIDFEYAYVSAIPLGEGHTAPWLKRRILADGLIYFYDFGVPFFSPEFSYEIELNDYQKMLNTPFHEKLWDIDRPFVESDRFKRNQEFIARNGTLKNYKEQEEYERFVGFQSIIDHSNVFWSDTSRLRLNLIYHDPQAISGRTSVPRRQRFKLDVELYFDIVQVDSATSHFSQCIFDVYDSYYALESDSLTNLFINLHFDLCEVERRKMEESIAAIEDISPKELIDLFELSQKNFVRSTEIFFRETDSGSSLKALEKYNEELMKVTGVDNVELFLFPDARDLFQGGDR